MAGEGAVGISIENVQKAQERIAEIERGDVQTIPGDPALEQIRQIQELTAKNRRVEI
jgi:hypothetical protein